MTPTIFGCLVAFLVALIWRPVQKRRLRRKVKRLEKRLKLLKESLFDKEQHKDYDWDVQPRNVRYDLERAKIDLACLEDSW